MGRVRVAVGVGRGALGAGAGYYWSERTAREKRYTAWPGWLAGSPVRPSRPLRALARFVMEIDRAVISAVLLLL